MDWKNLLGKVSESVNDELRLRIEYLTVENLILRQQIKSRVRLSDHDRKELGEIGRRLGRTALSEIATVAQPDTIVAWGRKFADHQVETAKPPKSVGCPRIDREIEELVVRMARENRSWGYDRIQGSLKHFGYAISDQTVGNILKRHGIPPAPEREKTVRWREFVRAHLDVLLATDFFNSGTWGWLRWFMSFIFLFLPFQRGQKRTMSAMAQVNALMKSISSRFLQLDSLVGKWQVLLKKNRLLRPRQPLRGLLLCPRSGWPPHHHRESLSLGVGKVALASPVKDGRIRDGPNQQWPVRKAA